MSSSIVAFVLASVFFGLATAGMAPPPQDRAADRVAIRAHIEEIFEAYQKRDRDVIRATHAENWRGFIRPSRVIVRGVDHYMKDAEAVLSGPFRLVSHRMVDFDVVFYGDTALVSYIADIEVDAFGSRLPDRLRVVDIYAREKGKWNQVGSQVAQHPDTQERFRQTPRPLFPEERASLLAAREAVWRAWYGNDRAALEKLVPDEALAINPGGEPLADRKAIFEAAAGFAAGGGKLLRLEFSATEIQTYGDVAILYTTYVVEFEAGGKPGKQSGRATEVFVRRGGDWVNPGWHLDSGK